MVYVDIKTTTKPYDRIIIDESDIKLSNITEVRTDNWGDDDCEKMVTTVSAMTIEISKNIAERFNDVTDIQMIRYNYYRPAYHLNCHQVSCEKQANGSLLFRYE